MCHRDLHPGNILLSPRGPVVIDWTQVGVGDPRLDVAWTLMVVGFGDPELGEILRDLYDPVDPWFEVAVGLKRLFTVVVSLQAGPEALGMRQEAGEMMVAATGGLQRVRDRVLELTGITVPEVEELLG